MSANPVDGEEYQSRQERGRWDSDRPGRHDAHEMRPAHQLAAAQLVLIGKREAPLRLVAFMGADIVPPAAAMGRVVLAEEADAEYRAYDDMGCRHRQSELRGDQHRERRGPRHAEGAHRVHLGDLLADDAHDARAEQEPVSYTH